MVVMFKRQPGDSRRSSSTSPPPAAATIWAKLGGFSSPNKNVPASVYSDAITRATEARSRRRRRSRFDMSDQQPAAFGATTGQGEWRIFQDFLENPNEHHGIQPQLEKPPRRRTRRVSNA